MENLSRLCEQLGYLLALGSLNISAHAQEHEWRFALVAQSKNRMTPLPALASALMAFEAVESVHVSPARN